MNAISRKLKIVLALSFFVSTSMGLAGAASSDDGTGSPGYFQIMPRYWYGMTPAKTETLFTDGPFSAVETELADGESKYGLSVVYGPANSNSDYVFTFYYGEKDVYSFLEVRDGAGGPPLFFDDIFFSQTDIDVELLKRWKLPSGWSFFPEAFTPQILAGVRYLYHIEEEFNYYGCIECVAGLELSQHNIFAEVGGSGSYALTADRLHNLVVSAIVGFGYALNEATDGVILDQSENGYSLRWEVAAGYQWQFSQQWGLLARYRALFGRSWFDDLSTETFGVSEAVSILHGPEIGIVYTFR